jgi:hypothetical protein
MREFFTLQAIIMFFAGVFASMWVKGLLGTARSKVAGG